MPQPTKQMMSCAEIAYVYDDSKEGKNHLPARADWVYKYPNEFKKPLVTVRMSRYGDCVCGRHYYSRVEVESNPIWSGDNPYPGWNWGKPCWVYIWDEPTIRGIEPGRKFDYHSEAAAWAIGIIESRSLQDTHDIDWRGLGMESPWQMIAKYKAREPGYDDNDPAYYYSTMQMAELSTRSGAPSFSIDTVAKKLRSKFASKTSE